MTHKNRKSRPEKRGKLKNALKKSYTTKVLDRLTLEELSEFAHDLWTHLFYWMGDPTEERLVALQDSIPLLKKVVSFEIVLQRLDFLDSFERGLFGIGIDDFFPELARVLKQSLVRIHKHPASVHKAECWLKPIARDAGADADVEAVVYFSSRGQNDLVDVDALKDSWHAAICQDIEYGRPVGKVPETVLDRARCQTISLAEAAEVLQFNDILPRFFRFRDEEEDFIDAAMFRAVEWLGITGFDAWLKSCAAELSVGPQGGIEHPSAGWYLFFWCRSDLALRMAERQGLEAWLWALINGPIERDRPWRIFWPERENPRSRDYLPLVGIIPFIWHRIKPTNMKEDVLHRAIKLLYETQMRCGAWPLHADDSKPSLITTCFAIHGLAAHAPVGWEKLAKDAAKWILGQQKEGGTWSIGGGPPVMLTVLALDSLSLAEGKRDVTFRLDVSSTDQAVGDALHMLSHAEKSFTEPTYDYIDQPWHEPVVPPQKPVGLVDAHDVVQPKLAIVVATEVELRQVLRVMTHLPKRRKLWKVTHDCDTYFLGHFGAFESVVMLSGMGTQGAAGATLSIDSLIREWEPIAVLLLGIAFGVNRRKQLPADVIVAEYLIPYEHQRVGDKITFRNPVPPSSPALVNRFRHSLEWDFRRPDDSKCSKHIGHVLSGDKLIDNIEFRNSLLDQYPNALGGEMEGSGLWSAAQRGNKHWILAKGVCDWADGRKHDHYHQMAAASTVSLSLHVFSDSHALDGL